MKNILKYLGIAILVLMSLSAAYSQIEINPVSLSSSGISTTKQGIEILTGQELITIEGINKSTSSSASIIYIQNSSGADLISAGIIGNKAIFDYVLSANTTYRIVADNNSGTYTRAFNNGVSGYPFDTTYFNWTGGVSGAGTILDTFSANIYSIAFTIGNNTPQSILTNLTNGSHYTNTPIIVALNTSNINTNMSYSLNGGSFTSICSNCNYTTQSISFIENQNNISFKANTSGTSIYTNYTIYIDTIDPVINIFNSSERDSYYIDWADVFNYSDDNLATCYIVNGAISTNNCSTYTFTYNGNNSIQIYVNDTAGNYANENFSIFINPYQYFYFEDPASNPITNFDLDGTTYTNYATIQTYDLGLGSQTLLFEKVGYSDTNITFTLTNTSEINNTYIIAVSSLHISIYDFSSLSYITQLVTINLIGDSFAGTFSTSNGSTIITNISELPDEYEVEFISSGYETSSYFFTHTGFETYNLNAYLQNNSVTIPIKYIINDRFGDPIDYGCLLELYIYDITLNSYIPFTSGYSNTLGEVIFNLDTSQRFKPYVTCNSITQVYDGGKITSTPITLKFAQNNLEIFTTIPRVSGEIYYTQLSNTTGRFTFTYSDLDNIISEGCLYVNQTSYLTETSIDSQCLSAASGSINVDFNTTNGLTYKAYGWIEYQSEWYNINTYIQKIVAIEFDFSVVGILLSLMLICGCSIGGFFMAKAKGVLIGATAALWIVSLGILGLWNVGIIASLVTWTILLIVGVVVV